MIKRLILAGIIFLAPTLLIAEDIYVTQCGTATGVTNGICDTVTEGTGAACNNAKSVTWFNTIGNWGAGAGKVSAGDTVHLCGTFTFPANGSYNNAADLLVIRGSGSEGSPVTILFETDTVVQSPQFSTQGGIICHKYMSCTSYVTIDGGTNGIIQNTNNGSDGTQGGVARNCTDANPCGIHASSNGLNISAWGVSGVDHIEVKNLTIRNIYLNGGSTDDATDSRGQSTAGINIVAPAAYISVHHNSVSNARTGIGANFSAGGSYNVTLDNLDVHHNYVADTCWGLSIAGMVGGSDPNWYYAYATNVFLHDNEITDWENWGWPAATYHLDGIITYGSRRTETPVYSPYIYNNYIHGKLLGGSPTAFIFCTYPGSDPEYEGPYPGSSCTMFNNLLVYHDNSSSGSTCIVALDHTANHKIYNNTCITAPNYTDHAIAIVNPAADPVNTGNVLKNNIVKYSAQMLDFGSSPAAATTTISASNNNIFFLMPSGGGTNVAGSDNWTTWQGYGFDAQGYATDPLLHSTNYRMSSTSSPAYAHGENLYNTCNGQSVPGLGALCYDKPATSVGPNATVTTGKTRPTSGAWDIGAYQGFSSPCLTGQTCSMWLH